MSYNSILDNYFSYYWFGWGIPFGLMLLYFALRKYLRKGKPYTFTERLVVVGSCFVLLMLTALVNPIYWGFGQPKAVDDIRLINGKLLVLDHIMTLGSRYDAGEPRSRIHVLDPKTGTKIIRFPVGNDARLIGAHGDSVAVTRYGDAAYFSLTSGKEYAVYSRETLPGLFPQLSSGIHNFMWGDGRNIMEITSENGKSWNLYTATGMLYPSEKGQKTKTDHFSGTLFIHEKEIRVDDKPFGSLFILLDAGENNVHQFEICGNDHTVLNPSEIFLDGKPVAVNLKDSSFVILHYETLKKEKFILTCMSLDGKRKIWEIRQSDFNKTYQYPEAYEPHVESDEASGTLWFSLDKELIAVGLNDGKLKWRTTL